MPWKSRPHVATSGGYHCSQLWRAAVKAPKPPASTASRANDIHQPFLPLRLANPAKTATKIRAYRCTMHIGQGSRPTTCCRYMPKASMATQATLISASTRRGDVVNQFIHSPHSDCSRHCPQSRRGPGHCTRGTGSARPTGASPTGGRREAAQGGSNSSGLVQKNTGTTRCHHQRVSLDQTHVPVLLRRNLCLNQGLGGGRRSSLGFLRSPSGL